MFVLGNSIWTQTVLINAVYPTLKIKLPTLNKFFVNMAFYVKLLLNKTRDLNASLSLDKVRSLYESNHSLSEENVFLTYTVGTVGSSGNVRKAIGGRKLMKAKITAKDFSLIWFYRFFDLTIRSINLKST